MGTVPQYFEDIGHLIFFGGAWKLLRAGYVVFCVFFLMDQNHLAIFVEGHLGIYVYLKSSKIFSRRSLIRVFPVSFNVKHFVNSSPDNQHLI